LSPKLAENIPRTIRKTLLKFSFTDKDMFFIQVIYHRPVDNVFDERLFSYCNAVDKVS
jgi:hypothetical protein